jgi:monofunctional biosynthetic peptidoglycan transglycosylase
MASIPDEHEKHKVGFGAEFGPDGASSIGLPIHSRAEAVEAMSIQNESPGARSRWTLRGGLGGFALFVGSWVQTAVQWIFATALISVVGVAIAGWVPITWTPLMSLRTFESFVDGKGQWPQQIWRGNLSQQRHLVRAVLAAEDDKFFEHYGFDFDAIAQAWQHNRVQKLKANGQPQVRQRIRGGSTITQQTAKNVFLWPQRSWVRKALEAWITIWIEILWPKERILDVYLNVIEFGPNVYGAEAASRVYFKKSAHQLSRGEAARLAAVLPNPRRLRVDRPSGYVLRRQGAILRRMSRIETPSESNGLRLRPLLNP